MVGISQGTHLNVAAEEHAIVEGTVQQLTEQGQRHKVEIQANYALLSEVLDNLWPKWNGPCQGVDPTNDRWQLNVVKRINDDHSHEQLWHAGKSRERQIDWLRKPENLSTCQTRKLTRLARWLSNLQWLHNVLAAWQSHWRRVVHFPAISIRMLADRERCFWFHLF